MAALHAAVLQLQAQNPIAVPPTYPGTCQCTSCREPSKYTIVLNFWSLSDLRAFRGVHNATRMYPAIVACEDHKDTLRDVGFFAIRAAFKHVHDLFKALSKDPPDMKDVLIDARSIDEALRLWSETSTPATH